MITVTFAWSWPVWAPPPFCWGVEPLTKFSEGGGLTGSHSLEGVAWKEGDDFFSGGWGLQFLHEK